MTSGKRPAAVQVLVVRNELLLAALPLLACAPPPSNAGEVVAGSDSAADDSATTSGADDADAVDGSLELESDLLFPMIPWDNGVLIVRQAHLPGGSARVVRVNENLEVDWSFDLATPASVSHMSRISSTQLVLAGARASAETPTPTLWRLDCCVGMEETDFTESAVVDAYGSGSYAFAIPHDGGILAALKPSTGSPSVLVHNDLSLDPDWIDDTWGYTAQSAAVGPLGNAVVTATLMMQPQILEVGPEGPGTASSLDRPSVLVGSADELLVVSSAADRLDVSPYGARSVVPVDVPGLDPSGCTLARRERIACAFTTAGVAPAAVLRVVEFEETGTVVRDLTMSSTAPIAEVTAVAVSQDAAIWVATTERTAEGEAVSILRRITPL